MPIPIKVKARLDNAGNLVPFTCILEDKKYQVEGIGRRWQAEDGEHLMVMFPQDRAVELVRSPDGSWLLVKDHSNRGDRLA